MTTYRSYELLLAQPHVSLDSAGSGIQPASADPPVDHGGANSDQRPGWPPFGASLSESAMEQSTR